MLWSLLKIIIFVAFVMALTYGGTLVMGLQGGAVLSVAGTEITLSLLQLIFLGVALVVLVWCGLKLLSLLFATLHFLIGDETALSRYFDRNREKKGYQALNDGFIALATGDPRLAHVKAKRAEKYIQDQNLSTLLLAQAASQSGQDEKAEGYYKQLLESDKTRFIGIKGLLEQKMRSGDTQTAFALAKKAFALNSGHDDVQNQLFKLQLDHSDWVGARQTLLAKYKAGALPKGVFKRRDSVLAVSLAKQLISEGDMINGETQALEAYNLSPTLVPAIVLAAQTHVAAGRMRKAKAVLAKAWAQMPHPDLAQVFASLAPDEDAEARLKRFKDLVKKAPQHVESKLLMAELHVAVGDFPEARRGLGDLAESHPSVRSLTLMAAIERGEGGDEGLVRAWLAKALSAAPGAQWLCSSCQSAHAAWASSCHHCQAFDTLDWRETVAETGEGLMTPTHMLPLLVGETQHEDSGADKDSANKDGA